MILPRPDLVLNHAIEKNQTMKTFITLVFLVCTSHALISQKSNVVYTEALGNGMLFSVNYDFAPIQKYNNFRVRAGIGALIYPNGVGQVSYLFGTEKHFMELGVGVSVIGFDNDANKLDAFIAPNCAFQYRLELSSGLLWRIGLSPIFMTLEQAGNDRFQQTFQLWPGMSLGYAF